MSSQAVRTVSGRALTLLIGAVIASLAFVARADAATVYCSAQSSSTTGPAGPTFLISVPSGSVTQLTLLATGGDYSVSPSPSATLSGCSGIATANFPDVVIEQTGTAPVAVTLDDSNGGLAGGSTCLYVSLLGSVGAGGLVLKSDPASTASGATVAVTSTGATLNQASCGGPDVSFGPTNIAPTVEGSSGGVPTTLDLSGNPAGVAVEYGATNSSANGEVIIPGGFSVEFSDIPTVIGSASGDTTFQAFNQVGLELEGRGSGNTLDLAGGVNPVAVRANSDSTVNPGSYTLPNIGLNLFSGISTITAPSSSVFYASPQAPGIDFEGQGDLATLDLSAYTPSSSAPLVVNDRTGTVTAGGQTLATYSGVGTFLGASSGPTTFVAGTFGGIVFEGGAGSLNTLDLSALPTSSANPAVVNAVTGQVIWEAGADAFTNIVDFLGSTDGYTTFVPGSATVASFTGQGSTGNVLNLTSESASTYTSFKVSMGGAGSTCAPSGVLISYDSSPIGIDCFSDIATVDGATAVPTDFAPNPALVESPSPAVTFVGGDSAAGGSVVDLTGFASPNAGGQTVSGLTVAPGANTATSPGAVKASVGGNAVTFANFYGITGVDGPTPLTATLQPGTFLPTLLNVALAPQTIAFTSTAPSSPAIGSTYSVAATGGASGQPVTFSIDAASTSGACSISGSTVSFTGPGTCQIDAGQAGNPDYQSAQAHQSVTVPAPPPATTTNPSTTSTTTTPAPVTTQFVAPSAGLSKGRLTLLVNDVGVKVSCPAGAGACNGRVSLQASLTSPTKSGKTGKSFRRSTVKLTLGSAGFALGGGQSETVIVALSPRVLHELKGHRTVPVTITAVSADTSGHSESSSVKATLSLPAQA